MLAALACLFVCQDVAPALRLDFESVEAGWHSVRLVPGGARGKAAAFSQPGAYIDAGTLSITSNRPFTLSVWIRTRDGGFSTPLMARDGDRVGMSLVMGRAPGHISFEAWSWQDIKLISQVRIDDGQWHHVVAAYEPRSNCTTLTIDGKLEACGALGTGSSPTARLRLGNNIGADQPFRGELDELEFTPSIEHPERFACLAPVSESEDKARSLAALRERLRPRQTKLPRDRDDWSQRRAAIRRDVADALGLSPWPSRAPLAPQITGETAGYGVRVQRITYSSWPNYRATAWLWSADTAAASQSASTRHPAMLMPHGHWPGGAIDPVVQVRAARFARAGYVVLIADAVHVEDVASGVNSLGVMTWNNIRALDYLAQRDDVDPHRIGVTGASGGALQTMHLMALDDRIAAAAPVCMISYFNEILDERSAHCGCNHIPRMAAIADEPEICATFAPRPALFISATGDWTHNFPQQGWPEIQSIYRLLGAPDAAETLHVDAGHGYDETMRARAYRFFDRPLHPPTPQATEDGFTAFDMSRLSALGPPPQAPGCKQLATDFVKRRAHTRDLKALAPALAWSIKPGPVEDRGPVETGSQWHRRAVTGADGVRIPFLTRGDLSAGPIVVVATPDRASVLLAPPPWFEHAARVVVVEPRFLGEWREFADAWRRNGLLLGCGEAYIAAHDIAQVVEGLPGKGPIKVVALGPTGISALLSNRLSARIESLIIENIGPSFAVDGNRVPFCPEILRAGDLPDLIRAIRPPCRVTIGGIGAILNVPTPLFIATRSKALEAPQIESVVATTQPSLRQP